MSGWSVHNCKVWLSRAAIITLLLSLLAILVPAWPKAL